MDNLYVIMFWNYADVNLKEDNLLFFLCYRNVCQDSALSFKIAQTEQYFSTQG